MIGKKKDEYTKGLEVTIGNLQRELFNTRQTLQNEVNDRDRLQLEYNKLLDENKKLSELNYGLNNHISTLQKEKAILLDNKREIRSKELNACKKECEKLKKESDTLRLENYALKLDNEHLSINVESLKRRNCTLLDDIERINDTNIDTRIEMSLNQAIVMVNNLCIIDDEIYYKYNSLLSAAKQLLIFYEKYKFLESSYENTKEDKNMAFNKQSIIDLQEKLQSKTSKPETEEATKQWFVMPLLVALGYDPYSSDIIPEFTLDVGTKKGEKVDYALQINNQPVALVECKQLNVSLSDKHISQLYRYFTVSDVHIAILTNGDDYWFFTDSQKENVMDLEPYYTIKLSTADADELDKFEQYSKDLIQYADIAQVVQYERYVNECKDLVHGLRTNNIPAWLLEILANRSGLTDVDKPTLAEYLYTEIQNEFNGYKVDKKDKKSSKASEKSTSLGAKMKATMEENKKNISKIKLNHEYVYNDYSDGDWKFHTLDYAIILGTKYENITGRTLLINTVTELFKHKKITRDNILKEKQFDGAYKINATDGFRGAHYIDEYDVYVSTSYGITEIIKFIEKLLTYAKVRDEEVKISFKS